MRKLILIVVILLSSLPFLSWANYSDTLVIIKGDTANKGFKQIELANYDNYMADTSQTELMTAAWTCSAIGVPNCNYRTLFKFDLSSIPTNSIVDSVKLFLYAQKNSTLGNPGNPMFGINNTSLLQRVTQPWSVGNTGWINQPTVSTTDQITLPQSASTVQNYVVDITNFAKGWILDPETNYGMAMKLQTEAYYNSMIFNSGRAPDSLQPTIKFYGTIIPSDDTCIYLKGDTSQSSIFKQIELANYSDYTADTSQAELMTAAWTCNALGYPTCNYRALFKYDLSSIPPDATITGAKLLLFAQTNSALGNPGNPMYGTNNVSLLQKVVQQWNVSGTGWLNQPATTTDNQKTLPQSTNTIQNYEVDVTDFVQDWVNHPETNYGLMMKLQTESFYNSMIFNSGLASDNLKPTLKICLRKSVLPIILKNFSASESNNIVSLSWYIEDGRNLSKIAVERSYNAKDFYSINSMTAKQTSSEIKYNTEDHSINKGNTQVYYRLKLINNDGSYKYSNLLLLNLYSLSTVVRIIPNPVKDNFRLSFKSQNASVTEISIVDVFGQTIEKFNCQIAEGNNSVTVTPTKSLAKGLYIVKFILNGEVISKKILKE